MIRFWNVSLKCLDSIIQSSQKLLYKGLWRIITGDPTMPPWQRDDALTMGPLSFPFLRVAAGKLGRLAYDYQATAQSTMNEFKFALPPYSIRWRSWWKDLARSYSQ